MILAANEAGRRLRLLAPGILVPLSDGDDFLPTAFAADSVRLAAISFALQNLCRREIRAVRTVHDWFMDEARRLYRELVDKSTFTTSSPQEEAVFRIMHREK